MTYHITKRRYSGYSVKLPATKLALIITVSAIEELGNAPTSPVAFAREQFLGQYLKALHTSSAAHIEPHTMLESL